MIRHFLGNSRVSCSIVKDAASAAAAAAAASVSVKRSLARVPVLNSECDFWRGEDGYGGDDEIEREDPETQSVNDNFVC